MKEKTEATNRFWKSCSKLEIHEENWALFFDDANFDFTVILFFQRDAVRNWDKCSRTQANKL